MQNITLLKTLLTFDNHTLQINEKIHVHCILYAVLLKIVQMINQVR